MVLYGMVLKRVLYASVLVLAYDTKKRSAHPRYRGSSTNPTWDHTTGRELHQLSLKEKKGKKVWKAQKIELVPSGTY